MKELKKMLKELSERNDAAFLNASALYFKDDAGKAGWKVLAEHTVSMQTIIDKAIERAVDVESSFKELKAAATPVVKKQAPTPKQAPVVETVVEPPVASVSVREVSSNVDIQAPAPAPAPAPARAQAPQPSPGPVQDNTAAKNWAEVNKIGKRHGLGGNEISLLFKKMVGKQLSSSNCGTDDVIRFEKAVAEFCADDNDAKEHIEHEVASDGGDE